ncbi:peptide/nickel transport system permease protein [Microbacterium terrae]|uniref:Dipeptide transport system permease protein DppB n=1 Tax=Microbacterium terrae TaxID=69369 RepID=A0A0M2GVL0_9MICO|nr:ABC transporter permease [Microbacterium terrae]KJL37557.1 Dipeptide transport system permease protein DppB [Microbacterium terrae]MBP1076387.1 peptide/nickel transport system permease protein [Microbacterium terrae]GLJ97212.1 ABC transporter permease [Microbacterium terrae]
MLLNVLKQLGRSIAVFLVVTFVTFALMYGNGWGIASSALGIGATDESIQAKMVQLGLDRPLLVQYGEWLFNVLTGDLGRSFYSGQEVTAALATRVPVTLSVVIPALILTALISVLLGVTAAVKGGTTDRFVQVLSVAGTAIPSFIIAIALVFAFAINWRIFPATGYVPFDVDPTLWVLSIALPMLSLLIGAVAGGAQQFRTAMLDTLGNDYVRTLRARGMKEGPIIFQHALRNAAAPGLTVVSLTTLSLLGGAVFVEQVFALPGLGKLSVESAKSSDVPMVMGTVLVFTLIVLIVNFASDLAIQALNPKARAR